MNEITGTVPSNSQEGKANVLKQGDKILNLLDDYGRVLTNPAMTLKEIEPLVERLEEEVSFLEAAATKGGYDDQALDRIIQELAVAAHVALFKFHRGDYL